MGRKHPALCPNGPYIIFHPVTLIFLKDAHSISEMEGNCVPVIDTDWMACS